MKESKSHRLNRLISDVSWNSLIGKIKYKAEERNVNIREINPSYSSQRCNQCGHISKNNRKSQSDFICGNCGNTTNADLNASKNILEYDSWFLEQKAKLYYSMNKTNRSSQVSDILKGLKRKNQKDSARSTGL